jgi:hypothetical protein
MRSRLSYPAWESFSRLRSSALIAFEKQTWSSASSVQARWNTALRQKAPAILISGRSLVLSGAAAAELVVSQERWSHMVRSLLRGGVLLLATCSGGWAGLFLVAFLVIKPEVERQRTAQPGKFVCGTPFVPVLLGGQAAGCAGGYWAGRRICRRLLSSAE